jgi:hypothetical protein
MRRCGWKPHNLFYFWIVVKAVSTHCFFSIREVASAAIIAGDMQARMTGVKGFEDDRKKGDNDSDSSAVAGENTESQLGTDSEEDDQARGLRIAAAAAGGSRAAVVTPILAKGPQRRRVLRSFPRRGADPSAASWAVEVATARRSYSGHWHLPLWVTP